MFVKKIKKKEKTHLYLVESYRVGGKIKHRTIKSLGILEELQKVNPEQNIIEELNKKYKKTKGTPIIDFDTIGIERTDVKNYGYCLLEAVYEKLGIPQFLKNYQKKRKIGFNLNEVMKLLVYSRILYPKTLENKDVYFEKFELDLNNIYRSLDLLDDLKEELQYNIHKNIVKSYGRDCALVFYNVTNYYFEIHENDADKVNEDGQIMEGFRRKGMGKDGKRQPLVVMGLVMDANSIPVAYQLFKGNEADTKTMIPIFKEISAKYDLQRIIFVADKGINSENNLNYLVNEGNGYILSQKARGQSKTLTKEILRKENYIEESENFKYKSIIRKRDLKCKEDSSKDRILKTDFEGRPIYVRNKSRIEGHFLTCFVSLVIMRVLQNLTERKYSVETLCEAIISATLKPFQKDILLFNKANDIYTQIEERFQINNNFSYLRYEQFKEYKKSVFDYIEKAVFP